MFIDTHCHVDDCKIEDKAIREAEWLKAGVEKVINMSCDKASMIMSYKLSKELSSVYFGVGVHPEFAREYGEQEENLIKELEIKESDFTESTFFNNELQKVSFNDCNFKSTEFTQTKLSGINFSSCNIEGIRIDERGLKGIQVNQFQAIELAHLLGIEIVE